MGFSWGWANPDLVMTTELLAQARLEVARAAMPQATLRAAVGRRSVLERPQPGSQQRSRLLGPRA
jgi:hypothetical protein